MWARYSDGEAEDGVRLMSTQASAQAAVKPRGGQACGAFRVSS
jgi:hypothetical protein